MIKMENKTQLMKVSYQNILIQYLRFAEKYFQVEMTS